MMYLLGIMTGSSKDGMDLSLCGFSGLDNLHWEVIQHWSIPYNNQVLELVELNPSDSLTSVLTKQVGFTKWIANAVNKLETKVKIDAIALHGHTVTHLPDQGFTFQMGSGASLYALTGIPVIADFRQQDIALGGEGTPMAPLADLVLFRDYDLFLNLGGIANVSCRKNDEITGYDIAPCNQVFDFFAKQLGSSYDKDGSWAAEGVLDQDLYNMLGGDPYFSQSAPKSLDNSYIKESFIPKMVNTKITPKDALHTFAHFLAKRIAHELSDAKTIKTKVLATGGGIRNTFFKNLLDNQLAKLQMELVLPSDDIVEFKESILMALLAYYRLNNHENLLAKVTGASRDSIGGALYGAFHKPAID